MTGNANVLNSNERLIAFNLLRKMNPTAIRQIWDSCVDAPFPEGKMNTQKNVIRGILDSGKFTVSINAEDQEVKKSLAKDIIARILATLKSIQDMENKQSYDDFICIINDWKPCADDKMLLLSPHFKDVLTNAFMRIKGRQPDIEVCDFIREELVVEIPLEHIKLITLNLMLSGADLKNRREGAGAWNDDVGWSYRMLVDAVSQYKIPENREEGSDWFKEVHTTPIQGNIRQANNHDDGNDLLSTEDVPEDVVPEQPLAPATPPEEQVAPEVVVVTCPIEALNIKENTGTLMFPGEYRQIPCNKFTKTSWEKLRKAHNLTGRRSVYVKTNCGAETQQNTALKYKEGHIVDPDWVGAVKMEDDGGGDDTFISLHPFGNIYIL